MRCQLWGTGCKAALARRCHSSSLPSSIPRSVMLPVMWVVRMLPPDVLEPTAFCSPIM